MEWEGHTTELPVWLFTIDQVFLCTYDKKCKNLIKNCVYCSWKVNGFVWLDMFTVSTLVQAQTSLSITKNLKKNPLNKIIKFLVQYYILGLPKIKIKLIFISKICSNQITMKCTNKIWLHFEQGSQNIRCSEQLNHILFPLLEVYYLKWC